MTSSKNNIFRHMGDGNGNATINPSELVNEGASNNAGSNHNEFYAPEQLMVNPSLNDQISSRDAMMKSSHEDFYYHFDNGSLFSPFDLDYYPQLIHPVDSREAQVLDTPEAMDEDDDDDDDDDDDEIDSYDDILLSSSDEGDVDLDDDKSSIPPSATTYPMSVTPSPPPTTNNYNDTLNTPKVAETPGSSEPEGEHEPDSEFQPPQSATAATVSSADSMEDDDEDEEDDDDTSSRPKVPSQSRHSRKKAHTQSGPHRCAMPNSEGGTCGKVFSRPYDLIRHQDTIHSPVRKTFKCDLCGDASKTFSRMDALSRHIRVKHSK